MKNCFKSKKTIIALAVAGVVTLSFGAWAATSVQNQKAMQTVPREIVPAVAYDNGSPEVVIPFVENGELFLSRVKKPAAGATTTTEVSRKSVAKGVWGTVEANSLTGEYLYQTLSTTSPNDFAHTTTWLGDANGKVTSVYQGAITSRLSPGGSYIALTDGAGILRVIDRQGTEIANFGPAINAVISPDGSKIAFFKALLGGTDDIGGLTVVDLASGKEVVKYDPNGRPLTPILFTSDSGALFFTSETSDLQANDVHVISLSDGVPRLVTSGVKKLPYSSYANARYVSSRHLLVLGSFAASKENTVWTVDTQTGDVKTYPNVADTLQVDSGNTFLYRPAAKNATGQSWNTFTAQ